MDREALTTFIERYKFHSLLWDTSSPDYMIKGKRRRALQDLVPLLGEDATIDTVRKKIDILRNGYFRELKKVTASLSTGTDNVYIPTLWYYDLMSFLSPDTHYKPTPDPLELPTEQSGESVRIVKKKRDSMKTEEKFVNIAKKILNNNNSNISSDQDSWFGLYLSRQLQNLSSDQRIIAEKLMSDVLYMARTNQLNSTSHVVSRQSSEADF